MPQHPPGPPASRLRRPISSIVLAAILLSAPLSEALAFCGFYVGRADTSLYNDASQVALVRSGGRTVISMMNDYQGDLQEFALVVPVPVVLEKGQIHVGDKALFEKLDAFSAPRLVEYFDEDPCRAGMVYGLAPRPMADAVKTMAPGAPSAKSLGVTIEAQYTVGEYDIVILSARESDGLETWLIQNGYTIPKGASRALLPYVRQGMKFFVARVNLEEQAKTGVSYLRPLQFAFDSEKFMLPIRLGMINARGPQDLVIYAITPNGRVETTNYRTVRVPTDVDLPGHVKESFPEFYRAMFAEQVRREGGRAVFTEHFWNMAWCDPCAGTPLTADELRQLGVFWLGGRTTPPGRGPRILPRPPMPIPVPPSPPGSAVITRLHVRYTAETFPEDLVFQETQDGQSFQGRYVLHHPWNGAPDQCPEARSYFEELGRRREREAQTLASLTGWEITEIRARMKLDPPKRWWEEIWD